MRKTDVCLYENKGPDQLCSNCFRYMDSTIPLLKSEIMEMMELSWKSHGILFFTDSEFMFPFFVCLFELMLNVPVNS